MIVEGNYCFKTKLAKKAVKYKEYKIIPSRFFSDEIIKLYVYRSHIKEVTISSKPTKSP